MGKYNNGEAALRDTAWIGDAVLSLYLRQLLLTNEVEPASARVEAFKHFSSNSFLNSFGRPTAMEAEIGEVYLNSGIECAFTFIETKYLDIIRKQVRNRSFADRTVTVETGLTH